MRLGRCITVGYAEKARVKLPSGRSTYQWCMKEYQAVPRKKDGQFTWRLTRTFPPAMGDSKPRYLVTEAKDYAAKHGYAYIDDIKQGAVVELNELELLSLAAL